MSNQEVRGLIEEVAQLSQTELDPHEFYTEVLGRVAPRMRAAATAVWDCSAGNFDLIYQEGLDGSPLLEDLAIRDQHLQLLGAVHDAGQPQLIYPGPDSGNPSDHVLGICPVKVGDRVVSLIETFQPPSGQPAEPEAALKLLTVVAGLATNFHRNQELSWWRRLDALSKSIHGSLHPTKAAYTIANDGRRVVGCDRLTIAVKKGSKCRVLAISGQETVNRRANNVRLLEALIRRVLAVGEPLLYPDISVELPPQLESAVQNYVDESQARYIHVQPLVEETDENEKEAMQPRDRVTKVVGALVAEQFSGGTLTPSRVEAVSQHASRSLGNALEHHRVFLLPLWAAIGKMGWLVRARTLPKTLAVTTLVIGLICAACFVQKDFELTAEGSLWPDDRRPVYSRVDGIIETLYVQHGSKVSAQQQLAQLENTDIDKEISRIQAEIRKANVARATAEAAVSGASDRQQRNALYTQIKESEALVESLNKQLEIWRLQKEDLTVKSPTDGEVITFDLEDLLSGRPVQRGQVLMTVANLSGEWVLELVLPDRRVGHFKDEHGEAIKDIQVSYILATDPGTTLHGKVKDVARTTKIDEKEGLGVQVIVEIDEKDIPHLQPGAKVIGQILCGKRSVGYVYLHEVYEWVQKNVIFRYL